MGSVQKPAGLRCGIVGAGIAGLSAAIALTRAGHDVEIFERSQFKNEVGAAISIQPNTTYILRRWGFDFAAARQTNLQGVQAMHAVTGQLQQYTSFEQNQELFGDSFVSFHRVDIHSQLRDLAIANGARLRLGNGVSDFDTDTGRISLRDGSEVEKDLVVVASGIHNEWVENVTGEPSPVQTLGYVYRLLAPYDQVVSDQHAQELYPKGKVVVTEAWANGTLIFTYPCREASLLNIVVTKPNMGPAADIKPDEWHLHGTKEDALEVVKDCHPGFKALVEHAKSVHVYPSSYRRPIPRMNKGRAILIGDAAHAMMPTLGQGAGMAIEDAAALEALFSRWSADSKNVETTLEMFNKLRNPRASVVQIISNNMKFRSPEVISAESAKYLPAGPFHPPADHFSMPSREYLYNHDIFAEAAKISNYTKAEDIPEGGIQYFNDVSKS